MLRPRRLKWDETEFAWIAEDPMGGGDYVIRKADGTTRKGQVALPYTAGIESGKCVCQSHYDAAWLAGGEEVSDWQPIGTGPKDCVVFGCVAGGRESFEMIHSERNGWLCYGCPCEPTHWMQLPKPLGQESG